MIKRFPRLFYEDHCERDLPAPPISSSATHLIWLDTDHPDFGELVADAEYYAGPHGPDGAPHIVKAAKRFLKAHEAR